jgi:DNA-binding protein WhiA
MSFAAETKSELAAVRPENECCLLAECYGLVLFTRCFSLQEKSYVTESFPAAQKFAQYTAEVTGVMAEISTSIRRANVHLYTVTIPGENQREAVLSHFGHTGKETYIGINRANLENNCCPAAFLRGAFLSAGTVTDPNKEYHLEFTVAYHQLALQLLTLLKEVEELNLHPAVVNRKGTWVVYIKGSENIEELLVYMGASKAAMQLMQVKMLKEVRNNVNRATNFETANINKTAQAAARQTAAILKISDRMGLEALSDDLRDMAELRLENPDMSLREMSETLGITRSGVNHRIQKLLEIADSL